MLDRITYLYSQIVNEAALTLVVTLNFILSSSTTADNPPDTQAPVISNCPNDLRVDVPPGTLGGQVTWPEPTATDDSGVSPFVSRSHTPMSLFTVGTTNVRYTFSDQAGNVAVCSFDVVVVGKNNFMYLSNSVQ